MNMHHGLLQPCPLQLQIASQELGQRLALSSQGLLSVLPVFKLQWDVLELGCSKHIVFKNPHEVLLSPGLYPNVRFADLFFICSGI